MNTTNGASRSSLSYGRALLLLVFGFSSGLPFPAVSGTLQAWLTDRQIDLGAIGLFSLVMLPYSLKFIWAPLFDRFVLLPWGRRRGWIFPLQGGVALSLGLLGLCRPESSLLLTSGVALLASIFSASQDVVLDAYRRDILSDRDLGLGSGIFITGYRASLVLSGPLALYLSAFIPWREVYWYIAGAMAVGLLGTLYAPEPPGGNERPLSLREAVIAPLTDYFRRNGAVLVLAFILLYKLGDLMAAALQTTFLLKMSYSKGEIALVAKTFGIASAVAGGLLGGWIMLRLTMKRALLAFGILQALSTAGFTLLALLPHDGRVLAGVIGFENITGGMGTAAFSAYLASLCNRRFSATQYALLSSLMGVPRSLLAAPAGFLAATCGWSYFFLACTAGAIPGLVVLRFLEDHRPNRSG